MKRVKVSFTKKIDCETEIFVPDNWDIEDHGWMDYDVQIQEKIESVDSYDPKSIWECFTEIESIDDVEEIKNDL